MTNERSTTAIELQYLQPLTMFFLALVSRYARQHCISRSQKGSTDSTMRGTLYERFALVHAAVPLRFDVDGLPESSLSQVADARDEMRTVLDRILEALEGRIPGLKVPYVEERAEPVLLADERVGAASLAPLAGVSVYYTVYVVIEEGKDFGTMIIDELRNSREEVLEESA